MTIEKTPYGGWENCLRMTNGEVELIITTDVGPRVIRYGFVGEQNELKEFEADRGQTGGDEWRPYGGHRLWHAPEQMPRTYAPDNSPVPHTVNGQWVSLRPAKEESTGLRKELDIYLSEKGSHVKLLHRIVNEGPWAMECAIWPLTVMAPGGKAIFPQEPYVPFPEQLLPSRPLVLWPYTRMSDPRWTWGDRFIQLRQDENAEIPQKFGAFSRQGWAAYHRNGHLFIKRFAYFDGVPYPDFGCNLESYTNHEMLELETLGPLCRIEPGASIDHTERWFLYKEVPEADDDAGLEAALRPALEKTETDINR